VVSVIAISAVTTTFTFLVIKISTAVAFGPQQLNWIPVGLFASSLPIVVYGGSVSREPYFWFGSALVGLAVALWSQKRSGWAVISFFSGGIVLLAVRPDLGLALLYFVLGMGLVLEIISGVKARSYFNPLAALVISSLLLLAAPPSFDLLKPGWTAQAVEVSVAELAGPGVGSAINRPVTPQRCEENLFFKLACEAIFKLPATLLGPFPPGIWESYKTAILFLGTIHFLAIGALVIISLPRLKARGPRQAAQILAIGALGLLFVFAALLSNYGIIMRFRAIAEVLALPVALCTLEYLGAKRRLGQKEF